MALTKPSWAVNTIQSLANQVTGQATVLKTKYDKAALDIKTYINDVLTVEQDTINTSLQSQITSNDSDISTLQTADAANVKLTGNQTVAGIKTFSSSPIVPTPTTATQAANKTYVDGVALAAVANDSLTEAKMSNEMKKAIVGGVESYNDAAIHKASNAIDAHAAMPSARVYHSANQSIANDTPTALAFNSERYDNNAIHDTATNNTRLTCKTAGKYLIIGNISWAANATGLRDLTIRVNGTVKIAYVRQTDVANSRLYMVVSTLADLIVNDYVELWVNQDSGGALNVDSIGEQISPEFMMVKVG